jgi:hypothetical protein
MDFGSGISDVGCQEFYWLFSSASSLVGGKGTYNDIMTCCIWSIFEVKRDKMLSKTPITHLINFVQNKIKKIESRDQCWGKIDIGGNGEFGVVSRIDGIRGC